MTNAQKREYREFLEGVTYRGARLTEAGKNSRVTKIKQAEEIVGKSIEMIVSSDVQMRSALIKLQVTDHHGNCSNAVRKYYEMRHGKKFPRVDSIGAIDAYGEDGKSVKKSSHALHESEGLSFSAVLKKFHTWLIESTELKKSSADQYKTYIKKLCTAVDDVFGDGWFESLCTACEEDSAAKRRQCSAFIEYKVRTATKEWKKNWRDWRSAYHLFEAFLDDLTDFWNVEFRGACKVKKPLKIELVPPSIRMVDPVYANNVGGDPAAVVAEYTHVELCRAFMGRLKTQSRYYPDLGILFPTRLMTRMFRRWRSNVWIEWLKSDIADMHILKDDRGGFVRFSDVAYMTIRQDGGVYVKTSRGESFQLMTRKAEGKSIVYEQALRGLRDISIDHIVPLKEVFRKDQQNLLGLRRLSELLQSYKQECNGMLNERAERTWIDGFIIRYEDELNSKELQRTLVNDLNRLDLKFELMDMRENSKKGMDLI